MPLRYIVHADDFGQSGAINRAIVYTHRRGVLSSCSLLVGGAFSAAAAAAWSAHPRLGVGLHLSLTTTLLAPPQAIPRLAAIAAPLAAQLAAIRVRSEPATLVEIARLEATVPIAEVVTEFTRQLERFRELTGRPPTHLDTHEHVHRSPRVLQAVIAVARRFSLPVRHVTPAMQRTLRQQGIATPDHFVEAPAEEDGPFHDPPALLRRLEALQDGFVEVVVHPGFRDRRMAHALPFESCRPRHLRFLLDPATARFLHSRLASYRALTAAGVE